MDGFASALARKSTSVCHSRKVHVSPLSTCVTFPRQAVPPPACGSSQRRRVKSREVTDGVIIGAQSGCPIAGLDSLPRYDGTWPRVMSRQKVGWEAHACRQAPSRTRPQSLLHKAFDLFVHHPVIEQEWNLGCDPMWRGAPTNESRPCGFPPPAKFGERVIRQSLFASTSQVWRPDMVSITSCDSLHELYCINWLLIDV